MKLLLIEDNEDDKLILEEILTGDSNSGSTNISFTIDWVMTLQDAESRMTQHDYDITLLDLSLPDSFGLDSIETLLTHEQDMPIVVLTGNEGQDLGVDAVRRGAEDYVIKGQYNHQLLVRILRHAVERKKSIRSLRDTQEELLEAKLAAEAANDAKTVFLAMMSHEFRTPLQNILGFLNLMEDDPLTTEQRECMKVALSNVDRLEILVNDIVDYSKVEKGTMAIAHKPYSPVEILHEAVGMVERKSKNQGPLITPEVLGSIPGKVVGDSGRLLQILCNLLSNAKKFTPVDGHIDIRIHAQEHELHFEIEDTGRGIEEATLQTLFTPFKQAQPEDDQALGGTGLGLAICKRLCHLMGGDIKVKSEVGRGTSISFHIEFEPFKEQEAELPYLNEKNNVPFEKKEHNLKVLLVEDDRDGGQFLQTQIQKFGHRSHLAKNGQEAIRVLRNNDFDLIVMDVWMPIMNGHEAARAIRSGKAGNQKASIPIIGISANTSAEDIRLSKEAGMNSFMPKPIRAHLLEHKLIDTYEELSMLNCH